MILEQLPKKLREGSHKNAEKQTGGAWRLKQKDKYAKKQGRQKWELKKTRSGRPQGKET